MSIYRENKFYLKGLLQSKKKSNFNFKSDKMMGLNKKVYKKVRFLSQFTAKR